jgi:predicted Zn-dependent protease
MNLLNSFLRSFCFALLACTLVGCETVSGVEMAAASVMVPPAQEATLGAQYAVEIEAEVPLLNDPFCDAWAQRLGDELVKYSPPCEQQFVFKVTADPSLNAFAIPGGHCYINVGLIAAADNEAEVAAVVGHEINHVTRRHGMRGLVRQYGFQMVSDGLTASAGAAAPVVQLVNDTGGVLTVRRFGREDEREADYYGVEAMHAAGYDSRMAISFFEKLKAASGGGEEGVVSQLLSTHPATQDRIDTIRAQTQTFQFTGRERVDSSEFQKVKKRATEFIATLPKE